MVFMVMKQSEPTESKCQKLLTISRWKEEISSSFFQGIQWIANGWIIGQRYFYHLPLKEWMTYYQLSGEEKGSKNKSSILALRLSSFTIVTWVELIFWNSALPHIVWIESHLLGFTSAFSLIWWILHVSIVKSFIK